MDEQEIVEVDPEGEVLPSDERCLFLAPAVLAMTALPAADGHYVTPWCQKLRGHRGPCQSGGLRWWPPQLSRQDRKDACDE